MHIYDCVQGHLVLCLKESPDKLLELISKFSQVRRQRVNIAKHQKANKHMKKYWTSLVIKKIQIKITVRKYYLPILMAKIKKTKSNTKC